MSWFQKFCYWVIQRYLDLIDLYYQLEQRVMELICQLQQHAWKEERIGEFNQSCTRCGKRQ